MLNFMAIFIQWITLLSLDFGCPLCPTAIEYKQFKANLIFSVEVQTIDCVMSFHYDSFSYTNIYTMNFSPSKNIFGLGRQFSIAGHLEPSLISSKTHK